MQFIVTITTDFYYLLQCDSYIHTKRIFVKIVLKSPYLDNRSPPFESGVGVPQKKKNHQLQILQRLFFFLNLKTPKVTIFSGIYFFGSHQI